MKFHTGKINGIPPKNLLPPATLILIDKFLKPRINRKEPFKYQYLKKNGNYVCFLDAI